MGGVKYIIGRELKDAIDRELRERVRIEKTLRERSRLDFGHVVLVAVLAMMAFAMLAVAVRQTVVGGM